MLQEKKKGFHQTQSYCLLCKINGFYGNDRKSPNKWEFKSCPG